VRQDGPRQILEFKTAPTAQVMRGYRDVKYTGNLQTMGVDATGIPRGYRSRNIQIAEACDVLFDIEPAIQCPICKGKKTVFVTYPIKCDHCKGTGVVPNHSGGTWTKNYANRLGKETYLVAIK